MNTRICLYCEKEFVRYGANGGYRYCSEECIRRIKLDRAKVKKERMLKEGIVHGRPVKEHYFLIYKKSARKRSLPFELTQSQFDVYWQRDCCYCGDKIKGIGLDRIDNNIGYTIENVRPCCGECNLMRRNMSINEFINHCKKIAKNAQI